MNDHVHRPSAYVLIVYPIILLALSVVYYLSYSPGMFEFVLFCTGYYGSNIAVGLGLHRLWSHDSYKTNKYVEFILVLLSAGTLQGPALSWASNHFKHHSYTDTDKDPHTPLKYRSKIKGFLWAHMGWMLMGEGSYKSIDKVTMVKLGKNKLLRWQLRYYWQIALIINTLIPALFGFIIDPSLQGAFAGFLFIGLGRALQQHMTFCVNSACHFFGSKKYSHGTAGDIWWLALFLLGENWHNFHHAFPSDYRNGAKWYHLDVHKWIIYAMSKCGLAWDLKTTAHIRIQAKVTQTLGQYSKIHLAKLETIYKKASDLAAVVERTLQAVEISSVAAQKKLLINLQNTQRKLEEIKALLQARIGCLDKASRDISANLNKKLNKIEQYCNKIQQQVFAIPAL